jgi:hypothetical protein
MKHAQFQDRLEDAVLLCQNSVDLYRAKPAVPGGIPATIANRNPRIILPLVETGQHL